MNTPGAPTSHHADARSQIGLASWLGSGSVFIVLLSVAAIAIACALLLNRLVQQQALVRAQLAVASARELLRRVGEDALSDARVLAERPTLQRLLATQGNAGLEPFLQRFSETTGTDVVAVMRDGSVLAQSGPMLDWSEVATALQEQGERFVLAPQNGGALIWGRLTEKTNMSPASEPVMTANSRRIKNATLPATLRRRKRGGGAGSGRKRWLRPRPRESTECAGGAAKRSLIGIPLSPATQSQTENASLQG